MRKLETLKRTEKPAPESQGLFPVREKDVVNVSGHVVTVYPRVNSPQMALRSVWNNTSPQPVLRTQKLRSLLLRA